MTREVKKLPDTKLPPAAVSKKLLFSDFNILVVLVENPDDPFLRFLNHRPLVLENTTLSGSGSQNLGGCHSDQSDFRHLSRRFRGLHPDKMPSYLSPTIR